MGLDLIATIVLGLFVLLGMFRGLIPSGLGLASLALGYVNAGFAAKQFGPVAAETWGITAIFAAPLVGTAGFLATIIVFAILTIPIRRSDREKAAAFGRDGLDRLGGGILGGARGLLVVLLLSILASWLDAARDLTDDPRLASLPVTKESRIASASSKVVESAFGAALGGNSGRVAGRLFAQPATSLRLVQSVTSNPSIRALQSDGTFWMQVENSQAHNAVYRPAFQELVQNAQLRQQLVELGAVDAEAAESPQAFGREMLEVLEELGPRLRALKADPAMQELANDPQVMAQLEAGDPWALLSDARVYRLASRIAEGP